jgi:hypothetical protein
MRGRIMVRRAGTNCAIPGAGAIRLATLAALASLGAVACGDGSSSESTSDVTTSSPNAATLSTTMPSTTMPSTESTATGSTASSALSYVAFGDSWPEGAHCNGCTTFAGLWADDLKAETGADIEFTDLTGASEDSAAESKSSASLLEALQTSEPTRAAVENADIVLIATGPNEMEQVFAPAQAGTCGGPDQFDCIRELGQVWSANFDAILTEIETLRAGKPTAIRLVNAANPFVSVPEMNVGLPENFATTGGALIFELLTAAMCDAAAAHNAVCVDVRPLLNGATMDQVVDENSPDSMRSITDALVATGLPELD